MDDQPTESTPGAVNRHIGIVLFPDVEELDAVGPWEVLAYWAQTFPEDGWRVCSLSASGGPVHCAKGLVVHADYAYDDAPDLDILVYPQYHLVRGRAV